MRWLGIISMVIMVLFGLYAFAFPSVTVRYRLTVEVAVDGKVHSGSSVIEATFAKEISWFSNYRERGSATARGEAVAVDIGEKGTLFALLRGVDNQRTGAPEILLTAFPVRQGASDRSMIDRIARVRTLSGRAQLVDVPMLVRFRDIKDPTTVEQVDPLDLARSFGPGVSLHRATIEIADVGSWPANALGLSGDPVTRGIEKRLEWLSAFYGKQLDGNRYTRIDASNRFANSLSTTHFKSLR